MSGAQRREEEQTHRIVDKSHDKIYNTTANNGVSPVLRCLSGSMLDHALSCTDWLHLGP
jgi:hypothetical protein